jgi:hypothetical protein
MLDQALTLGPDDARAPDIVPTQFDLALALMCNKQHARALDEYNQTLRLTQSIYDLRRRGLLYVARQDLKVAKDKRQLEQVEEVEKVQVLLEDAFAKVARSTPDSDKLQNMTKAEE